MAPSRATACSMRSLQGLALFSLRQFSHLLAVENIRPGATLMLSALAFWYTRVPDTPSGSCTQSTNPPWGRLTAVPSGNDLATAVRNRSVLSR